jgi:hypothetical protein
VPICGMLFDGNKSELFDTILYFYCFVVVGKGNKTQIFKQKISKPLYLQRNIISMYIYDSGFSGVYVGNSGYPGSG